MRVSPLKLLFCLAFAAACFAQGAPQGTPSEPVATVAGQPIFEQDLTSEIGSKLLQLRNEEYQIKSSALQEVIRERLLEAEAKKRGMTTDKLLEQEVDSKVPEPSDAEIEGYYLAVKKQINQPLADVKPQLQKVLRMLKVDEARKQYEDSLRAKSQVAVLLQPPKADVGYDPGRVRGDAKAPVTIVEFSDYQCPYCKKAEATMRDLLNKYRGRVKLAYRDFPVTQLHAHAEMAAEASRCAEEQGKFWEFHDALFADQTKLDEAGLTATAQKLGLDEKAFQSCLTAGKFKPQVEQDLQEGTKAGVNGTPGFFINGVFVNGAQPEAEFEKVIENELAAVGSPNGTQASAEASGSK